MLLTTDNGSIVVNVREPVLAPPPLDTINKVTMTDSADRLRMVSFGKNAPLDGEVDLKAAGQIRADGNLTLKELTTGAPTSPVARP